MIDIDSLDGVDGCYLLCASEGLPQIHSRDGAEYTVMASHYLGWSHDIGERVRCHQSNRYKGLVAAWNRAGIKWGVSRIWEGKNGDVETLLKKRNNDRRLCPICGRSSNGSKY